MKVDSVAEGVIHLDDWIFLIPGRKSGSCNVFVLKGTHKVALVDLGMDEDHGALCASLAQIGLTLDDVSLAILTHEHVDHVGGLASLPKHVVSAAHSRAATKLRLDDQFSMMSGAFGAGKVAGHVDVHLEDGTLIDLGGIQLRTIYTPGHCSGAICLYEPNRGALFSSDTIFAGGILGGIFASGNISDYINSLQRLREFRLTAMYPGHGRMSVDPAADLERAIKGSALLMSDTRSLFETITVKGAFTQIMSATVDYSRRAAERRGNNRIISNLDAMVHLPDADHPVSVINISLTGARLDRQLPVEAPAKFALTLDSIAQLECQVVAHDHGHTRLKFLKSSPDYADFVAWMKDHHLKAKRKH